MMQAHAQDRGFSLVEVLIAAAIASFALTGLSSLQITWVHERDLAWQRTQGTQWAQQALEQMRMDDQQAWPDGEDTISLASGTTFTRRWLTVATEPAAVDMPTLLATRMDVSWIDRHGTQHSTRLTKLWVPQDPAKVGTIAVARSALGWLTLRP
jgi:prepilin-type N-terminal cleavage/methylation domain-containing protein